METELELYTVSEKKLKKDKKETELMKKARKKQYKSKLPLNTKTLRFNLDQSFIAQHKRKLWYTAPLLIYKKKEVYGSLLLDESVGGNHLTLQFFTTAYELKRTEVLAYPQKPLAQ